MPLLADIQSALLSDQPISPILLRLRFLAARLGSAVLEDWVKHESDGYPNDVDVPEYRMLSITYSGSFHGAFRSVTAWPIPAHVVAQFAGEDWLTQTERQSISGIEALLAASMESKLNPRIPRASNLVVLFADRVLSGMHCTSVVGEISRTSLSELVYVLRSRILDLTIQLEARIPGITLIEVAQGTTTANPKEYAAVTNHITNNIIYGNQANTSISGVSGSASVAVNVTQGDRAGLVSALKEMGFNEEDANELAKIVESEKPDDPVQTMGKKATAWVAGNIGKVVEKVGVAAAASAITKVIASYYGLA